jgi:aldehyde dehydrogenase (NAD+)
MTNQSAVQPRIPMGAVFVDGGVRDGVDGVTFEHINPATGAAQWKGARPTAADVHDAVRSCRAAQAEWRRTDPDHRGAVLERAAALLVAHADDLAALATAEGGVPAALAPTMAAVRPAASCRYYAGWAGKVEGEVMPIFPKAGFDYTRLEPYGTVAVLVPWRNPLLAAAAQVSAALAAGNCVVLTPSLLAPFTSLRLAELFAEAGVPSGVLNVVPGDVEVGEQLAGHCGIDKISITASRQVARQVMKAAAPRLAPLTLEVGGPAGHIVFDDADLTAAAEAIITTTFVAPGGPGLAPPARLLMSAAVADELEELLVAASGALRVGDPADPATAVGPLIDAATCRETEALIGRAARDGRLAAGGERLEGALPGGFFVSPALIAQRANGDSPGECAGPVLLMSRFGSDDEAMALANHSAGGFRGGVYTGDLSRTHRLAAGLISGSITVNTSDGWSPGAPVGGAGAGGGWARQGGRAGLMEFVRTKNVFVDLSV